MAAIGTRTNHQMSGSVVMHTSNSNSSAFQVAALFNRMPIFFLTHGFPSDRHQRPEAILLKICTANQMSNGQSETLLGKRLAYLLKILDWCQKGCMGIMASMGTMKGTYTT